MIIKTVKTLTILELVELFHEYGVKASAEGLSEGIEAGIFPFAVCFRRGGAGNRNFIIFQKDARNWLEERAEEA